MSQQNAIDLSNRPVPFRNSVIQVRLCDFPKQETLNYKIDRVQNALRPDVAVETIVCLSGADSDHARRKIGASHDLC